MFPDIDMALAIMNEYRQAQDRYFQKLRRVNQKHLLQAAMVLFFRPTTHKETDR